MCHLDELLAYHVDSANGKAGEGPADVGQDFSNAAVHYALTDRKYDVIGLVSDLGAREERLRYTPYGEARTTDWTTADLNGDGIVNGADLAILLAAWGPIF